MKKKIKFYKGLLIEIIETLCTICLSLESICKYHHISSGVHYRQHFYELKKYSEQLKQKGE